MLGKRSDKLNTLLLNGNDLLGVLNERRLAIEPAGNTSVVAQRSPVWSGTAGQGPDPAAAELGAGDAGRTSATTCQGVAGAG